MNTHTVARRLPGPSGELKAGTEVDASTWKNREALESMGYITPIKQTTLGVHQNAKSHNTRRSNIRESQN